MILQVVIIFSSLVGIYGFNLLNLMCWCCSPALCCFLWSKNCFVTQLGKLFVLRNKFSMYFKGAFPVWVQLLRMRIGELSAVITLLMTKCLGSVWKWSWGVKEIPSSFICNTVIREWLRKKIQIEKKKKFLI